MTKTLRGPGGLRVVLDTMQVFPDDPGNGTPAMVHLPFDKHGSTYWCCRETGEIESKYGHRLLSDDKIEWLWSIDDEVHSFLYPRSDRVN